jgi:hypothetical protein
VNANKKPEKRWKLLPALLARGIQRLNKCIFIFKKASMKIGML